MAPTLSEAPGAYNYVVTAHKPTSATHSVVGNFTHDNELNLIVAKCTRLEIHLLTPDGLRRVVDAPVYGRIATLRLFKPQLGSRNLLFLVTERNLFCVLGYDTEKGELLTLASGDLTDRIGRPAECGQIGVVDPDCRVLGAHLYDGLFKVIPMDKKGQLREAFNLRLDELQVVDIAFLFACQTRPTIAVLYQDQKETRHVKTYEICVKTKDLLPGPWHLNDLEGGTSTIVAVPGPLGGAVLVGETVVVYVSSTGDVSEKGKEPVGVDQQAATTQNQPAQTKLKMKALATNQAAPFMAHGFVDSDGSRILLSDGTGVLHLLVLQHDGRNVKALKLEKLGTTSIASTVSYLDNGVAFVGSAYGDSQLVKLHATPIEVPDNTAHAQTVTTDANTPTHTTVSFVEILEHFPNLGPIVDFAVVDLDRHGASEVVTCSGVGKDGSLRVVRNGVGINERAAVELPGIKGLWNLRNRDDAVFDAFLVTTFMRETRVLAVDENGAEDGAEDETQLGEVEFVGFSKNEQTLWCGNVVGNLIAQVTSSGVRVVCAKTGDARCVWSVANSPEGDMIVCAAGDSTNVLLACANGALISLALGGVGVGSGNDEAMDMDMDDASLITLVNSCDVGGDVSCCDCSPLGDGAGGSRTAATCAVGLWSGEVVTLTMPGLVLISRTELSDESPVGVGGALPVREDESPTQSSVPRAVLFVSLHESHYLLVGLGDGGLVTFALSDATSGKLDFKESTRMTLGTKPITLRAFVSKATNHVFAASDRPTVIYGNNAKLAYSNVNVGATRLACAFNAVGFPDSLALVTDAGLTIGGVDAIQKLHVRCVSLGEQPRRIAHQVTTQTFVVLTQKEARTGRDAHFVKLLDARTFEVLDSFALGADENDGAVVSLSFGPDGQGGGSNNGSKKSQSQGHYYVVGTAFTVPEEVEPSRGRLLVFRVANHKLVLVSEKAVKGAVYALSALDGKVLAGINSKVQLFKWVMGGGEGDWGGISGSIGGTQGTRGTARLPAPAELAGSLIGECSHHGHIVALYVAVKDNLIVVGDLMKSVSLLRYSSEESSITEIARDFNPNWMTSVAVLDRDAFLGAENSFNLFTLRRNGGGDEHATSDEDASRLDVVGEFHSGEFINRFRAGSLVAKTRESSAGGVTRGTSDASSQTAVRNTTLFGTVNGVIGVIAQLTKHDFAFALAVEAAMNKVVGGIGGMSHAAWRSFHNEHQTRPCSSFVDGDLVERFLDLKEAKAGEVAREMKMTVRDVTRAVEALQRATH